MLIYYSYLKALRVDGSMYCLAVASLEPQRRVIVVLNIRSLLAPLLITLAATYQVYNGSALAALFSHRGEKLLVFQSRQAALCCREKMVEF